MNRQWMAGCVTNNAANNALTRIGTNVISTSWYMPRSWSWYVNCTGNATDSPFMIIVLSPNWIITFEWGGGSLVQLDPLGQPISLIQGYNKLRWECPRFWWNDEIENFAMRQHLTLAPFSVHRWRRIVVERYRNRRGSWCGNSTLPYFMALWNNYTSN